MLTSSLALFAAFEIHLAQGSSFSKALGEVAEARAQYPTTNIVVLVEKGCAVRSPVVIDGNLARGGSLTIRGVGKTRPRVFGSFPVKGWTKTKAKVNGRSDVWEADVSSLKLTDQLDALFVDGKLMTLARYPNFNPEAPYAGGWSYVPGAWVSMYKPCEGASAAEMRVAKKNWHDWKVPTEGRVTIFPRQRYSASYVRIKELDREARKLKFAHNLCGEARPGDTYFVSGFREELDEPGEWCHDLAGQKLYFIPPKGMNLAKALVTVPLCDTVFRLEGAGGVVFENLEICAARHAFETKKCFHLQVRGCDIHDISSRAIDLAWGWDNTIADCDFHDLGADAIHITGGGVANPNTVENCYFHHTARITHSSTVIFMEGVGYRIRHNLFHDIPGWAVFYTGNHHELTDNRVHHYMLETEDGAAFYTCNANGNINTVTARNWISDGVGIAKCAGWGPLRFFQNSHGLYFDVGPNRGRIYDNVIERVSGMGIQMNHTHTQLVSNNVFYCTGRPELSVWSYALNLRSNASKGHSDFAQGVAYSNSLVRNIWYYPNCPRQVYLLNQGSDITRQTIDYNWICPGKGAAVPNLNGVPWEDVWRKKWNADVHSVVTDNLGFKDPKHGDFTPKNSGLMRKLGIHPLVMKNCGLYKSEFRKTLPKEPDGAANHPEWFKNPADHVNPSPD